MTQHIYCVLTFAQLVLCTCRMWPCMFQLLSVNKKKQKKKPGIGDTSTEYCTRQTENHNKRQRSSFEQHSTEQKPCDGFPAKLFYPIMVIDPLQGLRTEIHVPSPIKLILNITSDSTRTAIVFFLFLRTFITLWAGFSAHYQLNPTCFHLQQFFQKNLKTKCGKDINIHNLSVSP